MAARHRFVAPQPLEARAADLGAAALAIIGVAAVAMAATGAYAYYNIKVLNRYQTSDEGEKIRADYEQKYLKYEKLPQPSITKVKLNVQLYPKQRLLEATGRYDLINKTNAPIREVHVRAAEDATSSSCSSTLPARGSSSDDKKFGYRIYRFDTPLVPGATTSLTFKSRLWRRGLPRLRPGDRRHRERHVRQQFRLRADHRHEPAGPARATAPSAAGRAFRPSCARPSSRTCRRPAATISAPTG